MAEQTCKAFLDALASDAPAPGGGGAAALSAALGVALCSMTGNLTSGKPKYAAVQADIERMLSDANALYPALYDMIAKDAEDFLPLAAAYRLPKETPAEAAHKQAVMEEALVQACETPLQVMRACLKGLRLQKEMSEKGSVLAISDTGAGAALLKGALYAASLNVFINTRSMQDRGKAAALIDETNGLMAEGARLADAVFNDVKARLLASQT